MTKPARPWGVRPHILDIAWARFPYEGTGGRPAADLHPVLVLQVAEDGDLYWIGCAMGTSKMKLSKRYDIDAIVMNDTELALMGLRCHTRFDLDRLMWLPWNNEYIVAVGKDKSSPVHAHATDSLIAELNESFRVRRARGLFVPDKKEGIPRHPPWTPDAAGPPQVKQADE